jgi:S1-C subfamily serine protease
MFAAPFHWSSQHGARWAGVVAASALSSYFVAALLAGAGIAISGIDRPDEASMRVQVGPGGAAERAGVLEGDRIVGVDAVAIHDWDSLKGEIRAHAEQPVRLTIERGGTTMVIDGTPNAAGKIAVGPPLINAPVPIGIAVRDGWPRIFPAILL